MFLSTHVVDQLVQKATVSGVRGRAFIGTDDPRRTVHSAKLTANQEVCQKICESAVEIIAADDLLKCDFTAVLQGW